jgi:hypothetical protein
VVGFIHASPGAARDVCAVWPCLGAGFFAFPFSGSVGSPAHVANVRARPRWIQISEHVPRGGNGGVACRAVPCPWALAHCPHWLKSLRLDEGTEP